MTTTAGATAAALGPAVDVLVAEPVGDMCVAELQARIGAVGPQVDRLEGWLSAACGEVQARTGGVLRTEDGGTRTVASWLAEQSRESPSTVGSQLKTSTALRSLPLVAAAVLDGVVTQAQAVVLARLVGRIPQQALVEAEPALVALAARLNPTELAAQVRHLLATHCEPLHEDQAERARARRYLQTRQDGDGMLRGRFALPLGEGAEALLTAIEALSRRDGLADDRTAGQRRADALVELAEQALRHADLPEHGGQRPQLSYVLPADWAARSADRDRCGSCSRCPQHRPASLADTVTAGLPGQPGIPAERLRHRRLDRPGHPPGPRGAAVRRPDQPRAARRGRAGPRARGPARQRHPSPAPGAGGPRPGLRRPRLHPPTSDVRRPPPQKPRRRRTDRSGQPGPAVPPPPRPVAPRQAPPHRPARPLAPRGCRHRTTRRMTLLDGAYGVHDATSRHSALPRKHVSHRG